MDDKLAAIIWNDYAALEITDPRRHDAIRSEFVRICTDTGLIGLERRSDASSARAHTRWQAGVLRSLM